jgi:hypothetical protein
MANSSPEFEKCPRTNDLARYASGRTGAPVNAQNVLYKIHAAPLVSRRRSELHIARARYYPGMGK